MGDTVRITVIATGFKAVETPYQPASRDYARSDLFAATAQDTAAAASSSSLSSYSSAAATPRTSVSVNRAADEDYIPEFLRRQ